MIGNYTIDPGFQTVRGLRGDEFRSDRVQVSIVGGICVLLIQITGCKDVRGEECSCYKLQVFNLWEEKSYKLQGFKIGGGGGGENFCATGFQNERGEDCALNYRVSSRVRGRAV